MENSFQTSFIPKKPISATTQNVVQKTPLSFITTISFIVLIISVILSVGFYFYKNYLIKQKESISISLQQARSSFDKDKISTLELFNKRIEAASIIIENHVVLSPLFNLIGEITIPNIQYTKFSHQNTANNVLLVKMSGIAVDNKSIAIQSDVFNTEKARFFKNVIFSNLVKDRNNNVNFDVEFTVDPSLLSYAKNIEMGKKNFSVPPSANTPDAINQKFFSDTSTKNSTDLGVKLPTVNNITVPTQ